MTQTDTLREAVARAIRAEFDDELNGKPTGTNLIEMGCEQASYTDPIDAADCFIKAAADAALSAIEAAGWRIVPVDAIPIIKAVAHIGVDFGYGPYQVEEKFIKSSREILDALAAPRLDATVRGEER